jgi:hypothetical protein
MSLRAAKTLAAILAFVPLGLLPAHANVIYSIHDSDFGTLVDGTITTDGTLGNLDLKDIVDWRLSLSGTGVTPFTLIPGNSNVTLQDGSSLTATPTALSWDFSSGTTLEFLSQQATFSAFVSYGSPFVVGEKFSICCIDPAGVDRSGTEVIATATPLPAAFPLFGAGLATMGLLNYYLMRICRPPKQRFVRRAT